RSKIVLITGAGISTSAGVSVYRCSSRTKLSSRRVFEFSVLSRFYDHIGAMYQRSSQLKPTFFHIFMNKLATDSRLHRHYTQNIDCLESKLSSLAQQTVRLHGRVDTIICTRCHDTIQVTPEDYNHAVGTECESCFEMVQERIQKGKRSTFRAGVYRPKVLLYGEDSPDDTEITEAFHNDIQSDEIDAVVIVGTRLQVSSIKKFAYLLCKEVKDRQGTVIWVNK
ncbi:DHS-like NAD/FAD-binding domain-containing protein, partial [Pyrenochaeta sp. MPI-SDFR-AT-0127]